MRAANVWSPSAPVPTVCGEVHDAQAPASSRHSRPLAGSTAANAICACAAFVSSGGPLSIRAAGAVVSIVKVTPAPGPTLPARSRATTVTPELPSP